MRTTSFVLTTASALALGLFLTAETAKANDNRLFLEQVGVNNFASANQIGFQNETYVETNGNFNGAEVGLTQNQSHNNNKKLAIQDGNRNIARMVTRSGSVNAHNVMGTVQDGNRNYAALDMDGVGNVDNQFFVHQLGDENYLGDGKSYNTGAGNSQSNGGVFNTSFDGDFMSSVGAVNGSGFNLSSDATGRAPFDGDRNIAAFRQDGFNNAIALSVQGNDNVIGGNTSMYPSANLNDSGYDFFTGSPDVDPASTPYYSVNGLSRQDGNNNNAILAQNGNFNVLEFDQIGSNNFTEAYQHGSGNYARASQK
jgi:hypothetical protein